MNGGDIVLNFENDYSEGAHLKILERLVETNLEKEPGYGTDRYTKQAKEKIKAACGLPEAHVQLLVGGTQTNQLIIDTMLQPYEGVIAASTGHIATHEAGAIEFTGHKVLELAQVDGKIQAETVADYLTDFYADATYEHMVIPGMVYISHPTEYGTLYTKQELTDLAAVCREYQLPLFMDGARLGYGLMSPASDVTLADIAELCDVFYIGGTKIGALCGEAVVFTKQNQPKHFVTQVKQHGALLAKGRLLGIQFDTLFTDNLYFEIANHAIMMAMKLKQGLLAKKYQLLIDSPTNQQFVILDNHQLAQLEKQVKVSFWEKYSETHTVVRFATSWATNETEVDELLALL